MSKSPNRLLGVVFGAAHLLIGVLGFLSTSSTDFFATSGPKFLGLLEINPLQNVIHLAIGAGLLIAALVGARAARVLNGVVGVVYLLLGGLGVLFSLGDSPLNILALNGADSVFAFAAAVVLLAVSVGADGGAAPAKTT